MTLVHAFVMSTGTSFSPGLQRLSLTSASADHSSSCGYWYLEVRPWSEAADTF